tara:strand:- start:23921 stop:24052 length:132 start_codon:yes stop_codon:yes gene_type:complete
MAPRAGLEPAKAVNSRLLYQLSYRGTVSILSNRRIINLLACFI